MSYAAVMAGICVCESSIAEDTWRTYLQARKASKEATISTSKAGKRRGSLAVGCQILHPAICDQLPLLPSKPDELVDAHVSFVHRNGFASKCLETAINT